MKEVLRTYGIVSSCQASCLPSPGYKFFYTADRKPKLLLGLPQAVPVIRQNLVILCVGKDIENPVLTVEI